MVVLCSSPPSSLVPVSETFWDRSAFETDTDLPAGWMRVRDTSGTYYWHIPTGTTQWEPPSPLEGGGPDRPSSASSGTTSSEEPQVGLSCPLRGGRAGVFVFVFFSVVFFVFGFFIMVFLVVFLVCFVVFSFVFF